MPIQIFIDMKYPVFLSFILFFIHVNLSKAQSKKDIAKANAYLRKVETLYAKGKESKTAKLLKKAYAKCPGCVEKYHLKKGEDLLNRKDYAAAEKAILQSTRNKNHQEVRPVVWYKLAEAAFYQKAPKRSLSYLEHYFNRDTVLGAVFSRASLLKKNAAFSAEAYKHPWDIEMVPMSPKINTEKSEYLAAFNTTESKIFFTRREGALEGVYYAYRNDENWSEPELLLKVADKYRHAAYTTNDDETVIVFSMYNHPKGQGGFDLFQIYFKEGKYHGPKNLGVNVNSTSWDGQPSLSPDGKYLYFSSDRRLGNGGKDIYMSVRDKNGNWGIPKNLKNINTAGQEATPFIHRDGHTLYFRSNFWPGLGDFDLFISRRNEIGEWSKPINLGSPINTIGNDGALCVMMNGTDAIIANTVDRDKNRGRGEDSDLFKFNLPKKLRPIPTTYCEIEVFNKITNEKLTASIHLVDITSKDTLYNDLYNPEMSFVRALPLGSSYACSISKTGFVSVFKRFEVEGNFLPEEPFVIRVELEPIVESEEEVILENVLFEVDQSELLESSIEELNQLLLFLKENPSVFITLHGHTDNSGSPAHNLKLSQQRADAVKIFLLSKGVNGSRIIAVGHGESSPIATNDNEAGRKLNRRTTFTVNLPK